MQTIRKMFVLFLAVLMLVTVPMAAYADNGGTSEPSYAMKKENSKTSFEVTKSLEIDAGTEVPSVEFAFTIDKKDVTEKEMTDTTLPLYSGIVVNPEGADGTQVAPKLIFEEKGTKTSGNLIKIPFSSSDGEEPVTESTEGSGDPLAKKITVDFSGINFPKPGVYRYVLQEVVEEIPGCVFDEVPVRVLDVYVVDCSTADDYLLEIKDFILYGSSEAEDPKILPEPAVVEGKNFEFVNTFHTVSLSVAELVTGNQGSKDKYFEYTVKLTNAGANNKFPVDLLGADASIAANPNTATTVIPAKVDQPKCLNTDKDGNVTATFYLQSGQYIVIDGLPIGTEYEVSQNKEDYTQKKDVESIGAYIFVDGTFSDGKITGKMGEGIAMASAGGPADENVGFTNSRAGTVPTGVMLTMLPGVLIFAAAAAGLFFLLRKKKSEE